MNTKLLRKRMNENYELILNVMTDAERAWAEDFERMEYYIERGKSKDAITYAKSLNTNISDDTVERIKEDAAAKERCNPALMEAQWSRESGTRKTGQRRTANMYCYEDYVLQKFGVDPSTGIEYEKAVTTNPEDALIQALDAAAAHGVSLDEFVNNPKYHTAERKAGRPKKVQE